MTSIFTSSMLRVCRSFVEQDTMKTEVVARAANMQYTMGEVHDDRIASERCDCQKSCKSELPKQ